MAKVVITPKPKKSKSFIDDMNEKLTSAPVTSTTPKTSGRKKEAIRRIL